MNYEEQIDVSRATYPDIVLMRDLHRQEMNCQIRYDAHHRRGFTSINLIHRNRRIIGYGCVGDYDTQGKEVVTEFYITPAHRSDALNGFHELLRVSDATRIEAQTNDRLLTLMLFDCCSTETITSPVILFEDAGITDLPAPTGITVRRIPVVESSGSLQVTREDIVAEADGQIIGKAGFLTHYNPPYGDVWMDVEEPFRRKGIGSFLLQEIKAICFETGRRPSARCNAENVASRRTLQKAGFLPCARIVVGSITIPAPNNC